MLTVESYQMAWVVYFGATLVALLILYGWMGARLGAVSRLCVLLLLAGLALAPAHPLPDQNTWAPAIFVAVFELLTDGLEAARPALQSLLMALVLAAGASVLVVVLGKVFGKSGEPAGENG